MNWNREYSVSLREYVPAYSEKALALTDMLNQRFPRVPFTVFETVLLNEFLNHLIAQNTLFVHAEKDSSIFLFRYLQEQGQRRLLYKPSLRDCSLYWEKDIVIIADLNADAPIRADAPHVICLEKLLVDIYADKIISTMYSKAEYASVLEQAKQHYYLDSTKMLVELIASFSSFCFCVMRSVLPGSSLRRRLTSLSADCVFLIVELTFSGLFQDLWYRRRFQQ